MHRVPVGAPAMQTINTHARSALLCLLGTKPRLQIESCSFSPNSDSFAIARGTKIIIYPNHRPRYKLDTRERIFNFKYFPNSELILTVHERSIQLWNVAQGMLLQTERFPDLAPGTTFTGCVAISPSGHSILLGHTDAPRSGYLWELNLAAGTRQFRCIAPNLRENDILINFQYIDCGGRRDVIYQVCSSMRGNSVIRQQGVPRERFEIQVDVVTQLSAVPGTVPNTHKILMANFLETRVLDFSTQPVTQRHAPLRRLDDRSLNYFQLSVDGQSLFFYSRSRREFIIINPQQHTISKAWRIPQHITSEVTCVTYSNNGRHVMTCHEDGTLRIWNLPQGGVGARVAPAPAVVPLPEEPAPPPEECPVCMEHITDANLSILACRHRFCLTCIQNVFDNAPRNQRDPETGVDYPGCPLCRRPITSRPIVAPRAR